MRLAMDACLIALIKIHVARRDIADDGRRRVRTRRFIPAGTRTSIRNAREAELSLSRTHEAKFFAYTFMNLLAVGVSLPRFLVPSTENNSGIECRSSRVFCYMYTLLIYLLQKIAMYAIISVCVLYTCIYLEL